MRVPKKNWHPEKSHKRSPAARTTHIFRKQPLETWGQTTLFISEVPNEKKISGSSPEHWSTGVGRHLPCRSSRRCSRCSRAQCCGSCECHQRPDPGECISCRQGRRKQHGDRGHATVHRVWQILRWLSGPTAR